jgi:hypothetical protein
VTEVTATQDDPALLAQMQMLARQLVQSDDALLCGQYEYLLARIEALIEIRGGAAS